MIAEGPSVSYAGSVTLEFSGPPEATATYTAECE